ncbi:MAG: hypothetical protein MUP45_04820 [Candidatus Marinimicrobia bacterium]|nr:hypothetical protein [Candidatus Neomarinimicrobiota bacterium]
MKNIFIKTWKNIFPILLVLITVVLCILNYQSGTWLSGWDTLHPEFDFLLNLKRAINGVWMEHQGLGATASQAHPAEIPRIILLGVLSLILPTHFLRYFYFFLCLIFGPLGVYFFLERIAFKNKIKLSKTAPSFLGALFYLLNLGTLQHFYVPLEMFATHYASIGWFFLLATKFLDTKEKKYFCLFSLTAFIAAPMSHTATLFYAFAIGFLIYVLSYSIFQTRERLTILKRVFILILVILIINSFWLLPNVYYAFNHGHEVVNSKIHRLFTNEAISQSSEFANIKDISVLKSFLFNWNEHVGEGKFGDLLNEWKAHLDNPLTSSLGYFFFIFISLGIFISLLKRNRTGLALFPLTIFVFFFLIIFNPSLEKIYFWLIDKVGLFQETLRFPFTKFSILLMFCYATYFSLGLSYLSEFSTKIVKKKQITFILLTVFITSALIFYMLPAFQGKLISPSMKVKIPDEYFQLFAWFNQQEEEGRIAKLPIHTFWGWVYHDWGYQGAGFLWFGLKQPLLDREFDRWSATNEQYYQEMSYALYSQNLTLFEQVLDKYQIRWLLLDESVIAPGNEEKILFYEEIKNMLFSTDKVSPVSNFGDKLKVYGVDLQPANQISQSFSLVERENLTEEVKKEILKQMPSKLESQIAYETNPKSIIPLDLNKAELIPEQCGSQNVDQVFGFSRDEKKNGFKLFAKNGVACVKIPLSAYLKNDSFTHFLLEVKFDYQPNNDEKPFLCLFDNRLGRCAGQDFPNYYFVIENEVENYQLQFTLDAVDFKEEKSILYKNINLVVYEQVSQKRISQLIQGAGFFDITSLKRQPESCGTSEPDEYGREVAEENGNRYIKYLAKKGSLCDHFNYPQLAHNQGYALMIESRNLDGLPLRICLTNYQTRRCDLYVELPKTKSFQKEIYLIPPMEKGGVGYDININNYSIGQQISENHLKSIQIFPLEYDWLQKNELKQENLIFLDQAYEKNWFALEYKKLFSFKLLKTHFLVNNWANGWSLENGEERKIIFIFLPQYLEYFGFLLLFLFSCFTLVFLVK